MKKKLLKYSSALIALSLMSACNRQVLPDEPCFEKHILKRFNVSKNTGLPYDGVNLTVISLGEMTFSEAGQYTSTTSKFGNGFYKVTPNIAGNCNHNLNIEFNTSTGATYQYRTIAEESRIYNNSWFFDGFIAVDRFNLADTIAFGSK